VAIVNPATVNKTVGAIVHVSLKEHTAECISQAREQLSNLEEVLSCWYCAGEEDFILKVLVSDMPDYERFVSHKLSKVPGIARLRTSFILTTVKDTTRIPLNGAS
jgi:Lrp/AsnC family leucine-responsive transcriptional regulator